MSNLNSYSKVLTVGHKEVKDIFLSPVVVEEKIDGSQFTMARIDGQLVCRSKGKQLIIDAPEKMFIQAVMAAQNLSLHEGWVYRCEYLQKSKHNTLAYSRVPKNYLILFDVMTSLETYLTPGQKRAEAERLGLECVPCYYTGTVTSLEFIQQFLNFESVLGGCKIEGIVVKNYNRFTNDGKLMTAKLVSEAFKEKHQGQWRVDHPTQGDIAQQIIDSLRTTARWEKAIQHLREAGGLTDSPSDIGALIKEIQQDTLNEEYGHIITVLFEHFWPKIQRGIIAGFPEWYKRQLTESLRGPTIGELYPPADILSDVMSREWNQVEAAETSAQAIKNP